MRVVCIQRLTGSGATHEAGTELDLPEEQARRLASAGVVAPVHGKEREVVTAAAKTRADDTAEVKTTARRRKSKSYGEG